MIKVEGYACSYCKAAKKVRRVYATSGSCARHESTCYHDPAMRACATCASWQLTEIGAGTHEEPDAVQEVRQCAHGHDREDTGMCNGSTFDPRPQHECEYWISRATAPAGEGGKV